MGSIIPNFITPELTENQSEKINEENSITTLNKIKYISQDCLRKNYFLCLSIENNKLTSYKKTLNDDMDSFKRKFNNILLRKIKIEGHELSNKVYVYDNQVYKFTNMNSIDLIKELHTKQIKNVLLPKKIYYQKLSNTYLEVYDYYKNGDMFEYFFEKNNKLSIEDKLKLYEKILKIVIDLHNNDLTHRDLKLENFVIDIDENNNINPLLIDFEFLEKSYYYNDFRGGTLMYIPPERLNYNNKSYNFKSTDIWSLGMIFYILVYEDVPWIEPKEDSYGFTDYHNFSKNCVDESYWDNYVLNKNKLCKISSDYNEKFIKLFNYAFKFDYYNRDNIFTIYNILY